MPEVEHRDAGMSVKQAAEQLGVHTMTVRNWIRSGVLAHTRFPWGHSPTRAVREVIRLHPDDVAALEREREQRHFTGPSADSPYTRDAT